MKVILVCSGGMSTSILIDSLKKEAEKLGKEFSAKAIGVNEVNENLNDCDIVLVAPQIKYKFDSIKEFVDSKNIKIYQIQPMEYTPVGANNLMKSIIKKLEE